MDTMPSTTTLTRRQAREIERRTGVRPIAAPAAPRPAAGTGAAFQRDTGEIPRNAVSELVSVAPVVTVHSSAPLAAAPRAESGARGMTVRAARPAPLVARRRRRAATAGFGVAAAALSAVAIVAPLATGDAVADAHTADLAAGQRDSAEGAESEHAAPASPERVVTTVLEAPAVAAERVSTMSGDPADAVAETEAPAPAPSVSTGADTSASVETAGATVAATVFPMPGGTINEGFGTRGGSHYGIDVVTGGGTCGADLVAAQAGRILTAGWMDGYGNVVRIALSNGDILLYAHLQQVLVSVGQQVGAGELVGLAGTTGPSTGCHLHFEVWDGGTTKIDPEPWLAARGV